MSKSDYCRVFLDVTQQKWKFILKYLKKYAFNLVAAQAVWALPAVVRFTHNRTETTETQRIADTFWRRESGASIGFVTTQKDRNYFGNSAEWRFVNVLLLSC
ncbi:MAG: hypothetical protein IPK76_11160 [Lewinellaceae bacterium]|nr:hypothetical protein [Lewinellaceae bacterium]